MKQSGYLHGLTFLVVDDSPFMRELLCEVLHHFDVRHVREASDGADALEIMTTWAPDIILIDWEMSPFDGIEFTRALRASKRGDECFTPVIMVSGHTEYQRIQRAHNVGVNEYLIKPVAPRDLYSRIRAVIERPRPYVKVTSYFGPDRRHQNIAHAEDRRKNSHGTIPVPSKQVMNQDQVNALFNPGSEHPDDHGTSS